MLQPEDVRTIETILDDYGISDMLGPNLYGQLLSELEERDNVLRTDAAKQEAKRVFLVALDRIIKEV